MSFEQMGARVLNYEPCHYAGAKLAFRGPEKTLDGAYLMCLGGTETYGKFLVRPYPSLVEAHLGVSTANLGVPNAGIDVFLAEPALLAAASQAKAVVIQITGAHTLSNRFFTVHPRRNDRFLGPSALLTAMAPGVDFSEIAFTGHLFTRLRELAPKAFEAVVAELKELWLRRMALLLAQIEAPTVLLWMGNAAPPEVGDAEANIRRPGRPLFIDREMVDQVSAQADHYIEAVASREARAAGTRGMAFGEMETPAAAALPGPRHHEEVADLLEPLLSAYVD